MGTITKKDLVNRIAARTQQTKIVTKDIIQMFLDEIVRELGEGNRLEFREFGVFEVKERAARKAQNPRTLHRVEIPAKRVVKFKVGLAMRDAVAKTARSQQSAAGKRADQQRPAPDPVRPKPGGVSAAAPRRAGPR